MAQEHAGHRERMYAKLENPDILEQELLEVMLYPCLPRRNTADLAHKLILAFGSVEGVFYATLEELKGVLGVGEKVACHLYATGKIYREKFGKAYDPFVGKFHLREFALRGAELYAAEKNEVLDIYLLDEEKRVVSRHRRTDERANTVSVDTKWLGNLLTDERICGVVVVHNHPAGRAQYSTEDELATRACQMVCNMHGKMLCDHVIFSKEGAYSYYDEGILEKISASYAVDTILKEKVREERAEKATSLRKEAEALYRSEKREKEEKGEA